MARTRVLALARGLAAVAWALVVAGGSVAPAQPAPPAAATDPGQGAPAQPVPPTPPPPEAQAPPETQPPADPSQPDPSQPDPSQPYQQPGPGQPLEPALPPDPSRAPPLPPPPYFGQFPDQPPVYVPPPYANAPIAGRRLYGSGGRFHSQFGVGVRLTGLGGFSSLSTYGAGGIGLDLLFRIHPRLTLELLVQYQGITGAGYASNYAASPSDYHRFDVPVLGGTRIHLGNPLWGFSPYAVIAVGATYSQLVYDTTLPPEGRWFLEAQGGFGFELRMGAHFELNIDLRGFGRLRSTSPSDSMITVTSKSTGLSNDIVALGNSGGVVFNGGLGVLF